MLLHGSNCCYKVKPVVMGSFVKLRQTAYLGKFSIGHGSIENITSTLKKVVYDVKIKKVFFIMSGGY